MIRHGSPCDVTPDADGLAGPYRDRMIRLEQLSKSYGRGADATLVLDRIDLEVDTGRVLGIVGPSGAGKSTLAQCIALLERPTSGVVRVNGEDLSSLDAAGLRAARRRIGTVFQRDGLFARRTAAQNVALPLEYLGVTPAESKRRVAELLDRVGLSAKADHHPHRLSGGQRQRVGIARALALRPSVLLSDEATSGLDPEATSSIVRLLRELRDDLGLSILFITHEMDTVVQVADAVARLDGGRIVERGDLVDVLRDAGSPLGATLRPHRPVVEADASAATWEVTYASDRVPGDWLARASQHLGAPVLLLGASVEAVLGETVGQAVVAIPAAVSPRVPAVLADLGLVAVATRDRAAATLVEEGAR